MDAIPVIYHQEPDGWWADSPLLPGWTAAAETLDELRPLVEEGVRFTLDRDDISVIHAVGQNAGTLFPSAQLIFDFVSGMPLVPARLTGLAPPEPDTHSYAFIA